MTKKRGKKTEHNKGSHQTSQTRVEKSLMENFVGLQRVMVNLSSKFDNLANQLSKLLELFEISAKALAEKNFQMGDEKGSKKIVEKLDTLLDQNKIIARGLTLMHELNPRQPVPGYPATTAPPSQPSEAGYQKSIASGENRAGFESPLPGKPKFRKLPAG